MSAPKLRIGAVSFLNTVPLIDGLESDPQVELSRDLPSRLADRLDAGELDVGLIPVVEYLRGIGGQLVPGVCIGARGAVHTVKVFSRVPIEAASRIAVDRGSRSSVALLRVLLLELHGTTPELIEFEPDPHSPFHAADTVLVIGDRADEIDGAGLHVYDLGQMWSDLTDLPFVFAAWVMAEHLALPEHAARREQLVAVLQSAQRRGLDRLDQLAAEEAHARGIEVERVRSYWREFIHYDLGPQELSGLRRFAELATRHGLIDGAREVEVASV